MLTIHPFEPIYQSVYEELLAAMPKGDFLLKTPVTVPYTQGGEHPFQVRADLGSELVVELNGLPLRKFIVTSPLTAVTIPLGLGRNYVRVRTRTETAAILVTTTQYAVFLDGWAREWFFFVASRLEEQKDQLNSKFGLRAIENQLTFQNLLPGTRMLRTLSGKLAVKSVLNEGGSTSAVNTLAAAVSGSNPVVVEQVAAPLLEPVVFPLVTRAQNFGGFEMHLWTANLCAAAYTTYLQLMDHLPTRIANLEEVTDDRVQILRNNVTRDVLRFDFDQEGCSFTDILTGLLDCFSGIKVWWRFNFQTRFFLAGYTYALDEVVDAPLACRPFDLGIPLDSTPDPRPTPPEPHTDVDRLDSCEESDPFDASDAWFGLPMTDRLDGGRTFDTMSGHVEPDCFTPTFDRPQASSAVSRVLDITIPLATQPVGF